MGMIPDIFVFVSLSRNYIHATFPNIAMLCLFFEWHPRMSCLVVVPMFFLDPPHCQLPGMY